MNILVIDDDKSVRTSLVRALSKKGYECKGFPSGEEALTLSNIDLASYQFAIIDLKFAAGQMEGIDIGLEIHRRVPGMKLLLLTAFNDENLQRRYVTDAAFSEAFYAIQDKPLQPARLQKYLDDLKLTPGNRNIHGSIIGESRQIIELIERAQKVADSLTSVLITGETGTGKELFARLLHEESCRKHRPYVSVNCSSIPASMVESELFGHKRGAFTGATSDRRGLFEEANGGTIFLDEIDKMPKEQQAKLLRVLGSGHVRPVGADRETQVSVRLITATNRSLDALAKDDAFYEDLFYRIKAVQINLPPLRERGNDILLLANHFLKAELRKADDRRRITFDERCQHKLLTYHWPGNVRELQNCIQTTFVLLDKKATSITADEISLDEATPKKALKLSQIISLLDSLELTAELSSKDRGSIIRLEQAYSRLLGRILDQTSAWLADINGTSRHSINAALSFLVDKDLSSRTDITTRQVTEKLPEQRIIDFYDILHPKAPRGKNCESAGVVKSKKSS